MCNKLYIMGHISTTPYHVGPLDEETLGMREDLLILHDFQLLTVNSQPYEHTIKRSRFIGGGWEELQQRPYLIFTMPDMQHQGQSFFEHLRKQSDIVVYACRVRPFQRLEGSHEQVVVTRTRSAKDHRALRSAKWKSHTAALVDHDISKEDFWRFKVMKGEDLLYFQIAAADWAPVDLLQIVKQAAVHCNLTRLNWAKKENLKSHFALSDRSSSDESASDCSD